MLTLILTSLGLILTAAGVGCGISAYRDQWHTHAGGKPLSPILSRIQSALRRLLGKRAQPRRHEVTAEIPISVSMSADLRLAGPPIPEDADIEQKVDLIVRRLDTIERQAKADNSEAKSRLREVQQDVSTLRSDMTAKIDGVAKWLTDEVKALATSTARKQILGLIMVVAGSAFMAGPAIYQAVLHL